MPWCMVSCADILALTARDSVVLVCILQPFAFLMKLTVSAFHSVNLNIPRALTDWKNDSYHTHLRWNGSMTQIIHISGGSQCIQCVLVQVRSSLMLVLFFSTLQNCKKEVLHTSFILQLHVKTIALYLHEKKTASAINHSWVYLGR